MAERYFNPFQGIDINVPVEFHDSFTRYCGNSGVDDSPFPRMIDMWFLAVCMAARLGLQPDDVSKYQTKKIIEGSIFANEPWRVHALMLIAVAQSGDTKIVAEPRKMITIASGLAVAGLSKVIEMLKAGDAEAIWNLSDALDEALRKKKAA